MKVSAPRIPPRHGLSLLEVLICVGCLVLLVVIALPWLLTARGKSRDQLCLTRAKTMTDAVTAYSESNAGYLPYLVDEIGWPIEISAHLDLPGAIRDGKVVPEEELKTLAVPKFVCPDNPQAQEEKGLLSYVLNGGYGLFPVDADTGAVRELGTHSAKIDLDGDGEVTDREFDINYATGACWRPDSRPTGEGFRMSLPWISEGDGAQYTLLLAENLNAGHWLSRETMDLAFVIGRERLQFAEGPASEQPLQLESTDLGSFAINAVLGSLPGHCPAPSSLHGDYVNAMYADGHGGPLSANIDPLAYARLLTSNGSRYGQAGDVPAPIVERE